MKKILLTLSSATALFFAGLSPLNADEFTRTQTGDGGTATLTCRTTAGSFAMIADWRLRSDRARDRLTRVNLIVAFSNGEIDRFRYPINPPLRETRNQASTAFERRGFEVAELSGSAIAIERNKRIPPFQVSCLIGSH